MKYKYSPIFRSRQQENAVLSTFDFGPKIMPIIEIIKESDRILKNGTPTIYIDRYKNLINSVNAQRIIIDLPIYLRIRSNTKAETIRFHRTIISNLRNRINYYRNFSEFNSKIIPVISTLENFNSLNNTLLLQFEALAPIFNKIAFRIFSNDFENSLNEIKAFIRQKDIIIYDIHDTSITHPMIVSNSNLLQNDFEEYHRILARSAINNEIQNVDLIHTRIVTEADNVLRTHYKRSPLRYNAFSDFAGIKKDDITEGGSISPGLIMYDPIENVYFGYRGRTRNLDEFETTIVPDLLNADFILNLRNNFNDYIIGNSGITTLENINNGNESGRNQAKFKRISMEHYLHCIKTLINLGYI